MGDESKNDHLIFTVDWFDPQMDYTRKFLLTYYPSDNSVEMYDIKLKRMFLSRIVCDSVQEKDFFVDNEVLILSRRLKITGYGNEATKDRLKSSEEATFAMIKPDGLSNMGKIISKIESSGFIIAQATMTKLTTQQAQFFYEEHKDRPFFPDLTTYITSGPVLALELRKNDAVTAWRAMLGPTDCAKARSESPDSIRALYGKDKTENAAHGSDSVEAASRELKFFFGNQTFSPKAIANHRDSTLCVIKPHALKDGLAGKIIEDIQESGFNISGLTSFHLKYEHAEEFYEIYKGVIPDYSGMVKQLSSGRCLALEISSPDSGTEIVSQFRESCGPADPVLARSLRPESLRAKYGRKSTEENSVHCTDLPEDGKLEVDYFFNILQ